MSEIQKKVFGNYDGYGPLSVTRSTTANATVNGVRWPFPASIGRITADGLLVEPARTQYVLNNSTHPKTAEVTGSLSTGAHVAWAEGAGNFTIEVDGATATGLPCTQAVGVVCSFTVTGAGTLKVTTDATVTTASVENGTFPTSFITTATGATTRNADQVTATIPTPPTNWCMALTALPESGRTWLEGGWPLTTTNVAANANGIQFLTDYFYVNDAAGNYKRLPYAAPSSAEHRLVGCATATTPVMSIDGVPVVGTISGTGTGILNPATTVLHFGQRSNGTVQFGGYLKNVKFCSAKAPKDCK
jgi:hypothetical protein